MAQSQLADNSDSETGGAQRPVTIFKHGVVEASIWGKTRPTRATCSTPQSRTATKTMLAHGKTLQVSAQRILPSRAELSRQAFQEITTLKSQSRLR